jgi:hypothetical protein
MTIYKTVSYFFVDMGECLLAKYIFLHIGMCEWGKSAFCVQCRAMAWVVVARLPVVLLLAAGQRWAATARRSVQAVARLSH